MNPQVKICGLAREEDVRTAIDACPDAIGFIFWPRSPRAVTPEQVGAWTSAGLPEGMRKVGVFVDPDPEEVLSAIKTAALDVVQLHGSEGEDLIRSLPVPVWKVLHVDRLPEHWEQLPVEAVLLDSGTVEMPGGTGRTVDVERARAFVNESPLPVWLAGGLNAGNVQSALDVVRPIGVDVSSGVEAAPGEKNPEAVRQFVRAVRQFDPNRNAT